MSYGDPNTMLGIQWHFVGNVETGHRTTVPVDDLFIKETYDFHYNARADEAKAYIDSRPDELFCVIPLRNITILEP